MWYPTIYQRLRNDLTNVKVMWVGLVLAVLPVACGRFPADPNHSFKKAQATELKVGLVIHPPFVAQNGNRYSGVEVQLIEEFAKHYGLRLAYTTGAESELIKQLEKNELHIVAGGFEKTTLWMSKAGLTTPYDQKHVLLVPKGENQLLYRLEEIIMGGQ